jgi:hypothetical protein
LTDFLPISSIVAIKIPRNPKQNSSKFSNYGHASLIPNEIPRKDPTHRYSNVSNSLHESLSLDKIPQRIESPPVNITFGEMAVKIFIESPPREETNTADALSPNPTPRDPLDSVQKPNADNKRLGSHESALIVFATFSLLILADMAINSFICLGGSNDHGDHPVFPVLYTLGVLLALLCLIRATAILFYRLESKANSRPKSSSENFLSGDLLRTGHQC